MDKIKVQNKVKANNYKVRDRIRHIFQTVWFVITNSYLEGYKSGKIYGGDLKDLRAGHELLFMPGGKGILPNRFLAGSYRKFQI